MNGPLYMAGLLVLALLGALLYVARLLAQSQAAHAQALERLVTLQATGTPTLVPATIIPSTREPEERISEDLRATEAAISESTIADGMVKLAAMYRERGMQVPRSKDLRAEVEMLLNGEVPRA